MSTFDMLSDFPALDELIQVIYQGAHKFIVLSQVTDSAWTIHLSLAGSEGRWWTGKWTAADVLDFAGHKATAQQIEAFADRLAESIINGELHVGNWSSEKGAEINLTLGPTEKKPVRVPLAEMEAVDAAKYATSVLGLIASYASTRKCRLCPSPYESVGSAGDSSSIRVSSRNADPVVPEKPKTVEPVKSTKPKPLAAEPSIKEKVAEDRIKQLEAELAKEKRKAPHDEAPRPDSSLLQSKAKTKAPAARPIKGASLANPNKKARKYQALEFED